MSNASKVEPAEMKQQMKVANQFILKMESIAFFQNTVASSE